MQSHPQTFPISPQWRGSELVDPVFPKFLDPIAVQRGSPCTQFSPGIPPEIVDRDSGQIDLGESHRMPINGRLSARIDVVNKNAHELLPRSVRVDGAAGLSRGFDLDAFDASLYRVGWIDSLHNQVGMTIEIPIFGEDSRMFRHTRREHI